MENKTMAWHVPVSTSQSGNVVSLPNGDDAFIAAGVVINSDNAITIQGVGPTEVIIAGTVTSGQSAIALGSPVIPGEIELTIEAGGRVRSHSPIGTAVFLSSGDSSVNNAGLLEGGFGIKLGGGAIGASTIINSGSIIADTIGISPEGSTQQTVKLINSGLISGHNGSYVGIGVPTNIDLITNTGRMIGNIELDGGNDRYSGASGRLTGTLIAGAGNDVATGGVDNDRFEGGNGGDTLNGGAGNDVLLGDTGNDKLLGGIGNDSLNGGSNIDTLTGGLGADKLTGGLNADRFVFNSVVESRTSSGRDTILDFSRAQGDKIQLNAIDANVTTGGNQAFKFIGSAAFTGDAGELRTQKIGTDTHIYADVNGDKLADFSVISNVPLAFAKADFVL